MTRARAKNSKQDLLIRFFYFIDFSPFLDPDQFPPIPFFAKALKILLHDVQNSGDDATLGKAGIDDAESDDGVSFELIFPSLPLLINYIYLLQDDEWADDGAEFRTGDDDLDLLSGPCTSISIRSDIETDSLKNVFFAYQICLMVVDLLQNI